MNELRTLITEAFGNKELLKGTSHREAVIETLSLIDKGKVRVAEKNGNNWEVNEWVKQAILLYFSVAEMSSIEVGPFHFYDKIPLKKNVEELGVRVVPPATIRYGTFLERGAVVMPSYINIGAYVGAGSMIDIWATVGSCAQIGSGVHVSANATIGGVLEPPNATPVIVEDGAFIGSGSQVVEGVLIEEEAVLGANVTITSSTKIIDVTKSEPVIYTGRVPKRSVVIPGTTKKKFPAGEYDVPCALIVGTRSESTDKKVSLNAVLREFAL